MICWFYRILWPLLMASNPSPDLGPSLWQAIVMLGLAVPAGTPVSWEKMQLSPLLRVLWVKKHLQAGKKEVGELGQSVWREQTISCRMEKMETSMRCETEGTERALHPHTKNKTHIVNPSIMKLFRQNLSVLEVTYKKKCRFMYVWLL